VKRKKQLLFWVLKFLTVAAYAQEDSIKRLKLQDVLQWVAAYHPVMKQADLNLEQGRFALRQGRGSFDPQLKGTWDEKNFKNKQYYQYINSYVSVPLWIGELKAGYEQNQGLYINPDRTVPEEGLWYAGITVPLGYGLFIDERRNALRQGQLMQEMAAAERLKAINKLYYQVVKDYWNWYFAYKKKEALQRAYDLVNARYEFTLEKVKMGEEAPIDSLEAGINRQDRLVMLLEAEAELTQARLALSAHLWTEDATPVELNDDVIPEEPSSAAERSFQELYPLETLKQHLETQHPELQKLRLKYQSLDFERRLYTEKMKPKINLNYNFLSAQPVKSGEWNSVYLQNNYKFGLEFAFPLFMREAGGKRQQVRVKQLQNEQEQTYLLRTLNNDLEAAYRALLLTGQNLHNLRSMVQNYRALRDGEYAKFVAGESYVFLVNKREEKLLDAEIKLAKTQAHYEKLKAEVLWLSGLSLWELP